MPADLFSRLTRIAFWGALLFAYVCAIMPGGPEIGSSDKATHLLAFATLAFLARLGWPTRGGVRLAGLLVLFGIFIELSQAVPIIHRDCDWRDVVADTIGIAIGLLAAVPAAHLIRRLA